MNPKVSGLLHLLLCLVGLAIGFTVSRLQPGALVRIYTDVYSEQRFALTENEREQLLDKVAKSGDGEAAHRLFSYYLYYHGNQQQAEHWLTQARRLGDKGALDFRGNLDGTASTSGQ